MKESIFRSMVLRVRREFRGCSGWCPSARTRVLGPTVDEAWLTCASAGGIASSVTLVASFDTPANFARRPRSAPSCVFSNVSFLVHRLPTGSSARAPSSVDVSYIPNPAEAFVPRGRSPQFFAITASHEECECRRGVV